MAPADSPHQTVVTSISDTLFYDYVNHITGLFLDFLPDIFAKSYDMAGCLHPNQAPGIGK